MAVTVSDANASGKSNRFVGICIEKGCTGLRAYFILRNIVDHVGESLFSFTLSFTKMYTLLLVK